MTLRGDIQIKSGSIFYVERSFYIREGTLTFNEDETRFTPMLAARAEIRDRTDDGAVTIWLVIDNQPLTSFQARFESSPALSQADIFMLLGQSIVGTAAADTGEISGAFSGAISDMFSQFYIVRRGEKTVRGLLGLDMFTIRTQAFTNIFLQVAGREENFRLGRYFDNTSIFAGKYITSDLFLQGMLSLRYDETSSLAAQPGLRLEPDFGIELRNPLFDIRFNITPTHPESLFIPDTSVSLVWRRTF